MTAARENFTRWSVMLVLPAAAIAFRVVDFPGRYSVRNMDEMGYCQGSLQLLEGITPGYKAAPAGPLIWAGWTYLGGEVVWDLTHPLPSQRRQPAALRPFTALDRVLFENCRDISALHRAMVVLNVLLALLGVTASIALGYRLGGHAGGVIFGVLFGFTPVFLELSEMSRPYSMAWVFGVCSLYFASRARSRSLAEIAQPVTMPASQSGWILPAIFLGLSIASRVEMLCLVPLVWWVYSTTGKPAGYKIAAFKLTVLSLCIATWLAPWLMTQLVGNLRTIATVRFEGTARLPWNRAIWEFAWNQAMGPIVLLAIVGVCVQPAGTRLRVSLLAIYTLLLTASMATGLADGFHQHGAVFIAWFLLAAIVVPAMLRRGPRAVVVCLLVAVALPAVQAVLLIRSQKAMEDHEDSVAWVEQHVPAGTTVYLIEGGEKTLLPTPEASTALWNEVTDDQAWRKKMESGLKRFNISADQLPRALSEENLIQERGNRRKWFILGGHTELSVPRYDVKIVLSSPVFGIHDLASAMQKQGGIFIWRTGFAVQPPAWLGAPIAEWTSPQGSGVQIYCTPEIRRNIR